jgi:hypothetical protein
MKSFLRENFVLIAGLALPIILTLMFITAANLKQPLKNPPAYPLIYATHYYNTSFYGFNVTDKGELEFTFTPPKDDIRYAPPRVYTYNPVTKIEEEIKLPSFENDKKFKQIIPYPKKLSGNAESPDGWRFEYDYEYSEGNLMTYMFGGGSRYGSRNVLKKDYHRVPVSDRRHENGHFIAWVLPENQQ